MKPNDKSRERILIGGREFFARLRAHRLSVFSSERWVGWMMDWVMSRQDLKAEVFALVEALPELSTEQQLFTRMEQSFLQMKDLPWVLRLGLRIAGLMGGLGRKMVGAIVRRGVEKVARQFIAGSDPGEMVRKLARLRRRGRYAFTVDVLGEDTTNPQQVERYVGTYLELLDALDSAQSQWASLDRADGELDWGGSPRVNLSVKPSALWAGQDPTDVDATVAQILDPARRIYRRVIQAGAFLCIDSETRAYRNATLQLYRQLRSDAEFRDHPHLGVALQVYFRDSEQVLENLLAWARRQGVTISIRLVKGAYWENEVACAEAAGVEPTVYTVKARTDVAFERTTEIILRNHDICHLACASHNVRSVCATIAAAERLGTPPQRYEFQALYGMAAPFRRALLETAGQVRLYCPYGNLLEGMAYLVRRLLENTSNESALRLTFAEDTDRDRLLDDPRATLERMAAQSD